MSSALAHEPALREAPARRARGAGGARAEQPDRRRNILLAAEKLFAQQGYHGVSIRDIAAEAGVPLALVGYHFGAKHELFRAIFQSWQPMLQARLSGLQAALTAAPPSRRLARIIDAFVGPVVALHQRPEGRYYALMVAQNMTLPAPDAEAVQREFFDPLAHAFIDALCAVNPGATRGQVAWCYQFMLGALLHFLTDTRVERLSRGENRAADPAAVAALLAFVQAGFKAALVPSGPTAASAPSAASSSKAASVPRARPTPKKPRRPA